MSVHSWLHNLRSILAPGRGQRHDRRRGSLRAATHRLKLEVLEDRRVPAFLAAGNYSVSNPMTVVTADFNNDGNLDLATLNLDLATYDGSVSVLLGNGDGTFQAARNFYAGPRPVSIAVGDFNNDGKLDIVTGNFVGYYGVAVDVLSGNGDGTFGWPRETYDPGDSTVAVAVGDFNADGKLDIAVTGEPYWNSQRSEIIVLLGHGDGTFTESGYLDLAYDYAPFIVPGDFNRDGKLDLAWTVRDQPVVNVLLGNGYGGIGGARSFATGGVPSFVAVADLNGDGDPDLVTDAGTLLGNGDGSFQGSGNYGAASAVGDFNGDGSLDQIWGSDLLPGNGNDVGMFPGGAGTAAVGDFNGDGLWDMAVPDSWSNSVWVGLNDGVWDGPLPPLLPSLRINDVTVAEGNTGTVAASFVVTLSAASTETVTVAYATGNSIAVAGSDYQAGSGTLTFAPGETSKTITVSVIGDRLAEPNETFVVNLSAPTNATIADGLGLGTILDDEPRISINDVTVTEGNTGAVNATFTVSLSVASDVAVTVHYQTANGSATAGGDYAAVSGDVIIAAGQTSKTFTVAVIGDRLGEPTENFVVNLSTATNGSIADAQGLGTIVDNEPRISISDVTKKEGKKNQTTQFIFTVTLSTPYDQPVTMSFRTVNGTATSGSGDYVAKAGTLTFAPGETTKTITIVVKGDAKREANKYFYLDLSGSSSNSLFTKNRGIGTILNDD